MTQFTFDASRLRGVDLSRVPNQKIPFKRTNRTPLNPLSASVTKASISAAANVSTVGEWTSIPQDFGGGSLKASMVMPSSTSGSVATSTPSRPPSTIGVTVDLTAVVVLGLTGNAGPYLQGDPLEFGVLGALGFAGSTSLGLSAAVDMFVLSGPISVLDGLGMTIVVDVGVSKTMFAGLGLLVALPSWDIVGVVSEFGLGDSIGPPVTLNISLTYGGHIKLL
jgi:hypothetical protein